MPRMKRVIRSGDVLEQEVFSVAPNTKNLREAEPRPAAERTEEEKEEYNKRKSLKRFIRIVNANFGPPAYYVTNTFDDRHLPPDFKGARAALDNYFRRLRYACPGMVAVAVIGRGKRTGRLHIHCIISGVPEKAIKGKWTHGKVKRAEHLRAHNYYDGKDHGCDYTALATYLFNHWTKEQGGKRWKPTKTLQQPIREKPTLPKRKYSVGKPPKAPKGYILVEARESPHFAGGYLYFKYVRIPPPTSGEVKMQC